MPSFVFTTSSRLMAGDYPPQARLIPAHRWPWVGTARWIAGTWGLTKGQLRSELIHRPVHTLRRKGHWINEIEGVGQQGRYFDTKSAAVEAGRDLAQVERTDHLIHDDQGAIGERNSYGPT